MKFMKERMYCVAYASNKLSKNKVRQPFKADARVLYVSLSRLTLAKLTLAFGNVSLSRLTYKTVSYFYVVPKRARSQF